jgi:putative thioredoxin
MSISPYVLDADAASFQSLVIDESHRVPVLVDFWAEWCGPCHTLAPVLEKLADEFQGRFLVVKIDTDREQAVAAQFGIRSLPTVKLFKDGAVVDEFMGAQPESQVRAILARHVSRESDDARVDARALVERGEPEQARALLEKAHAADPNNARLVPDLANVLIDLGELTAAKALLDALPVNERAEGEVQAALARLSFADAAAESPEADDLLQAIDADPKDCESRYRLAAIQITRGDYEAALEQFLEILRTDRGFRDDAGRKGMLSVFEMLSSDDPLVGRYRSRMSSLLY